jgi:2-polyprenyl-3-methyl-5-hydroxy-6-metoxy-1,4-benzoquinol methylase
MFDQQPMNLLCPTCHRPIDEENICPSGHIYYGQGGVLELLDEKFGAKLHAFTARFSQFRQQENRRIITRAIYPRLPHILSHDHEWRLRGYDLAIIRRLLSRKMNVRVLDIGAWNGWLCHHLAEMGHIVTGIDFFSDPFDGLGAKQFYPSDWQAIQMNLDDLSVLDGTFDVVILNRCLQFFPEPLAYAAQACAKIAPGGMLILTGLQFFREPRTKIRQIKAYEQRFREQYGFEIFLRPTKGYLDNNDQQQLVKMGVNLFSYPKLLISNLKAMLVPETPRHFYGVWNKP